MGAQYLRFFVELLHGAHTNQTKIDGLIGMPPVVTH
jgi:hypothetical protein